jgi:hypothetical protein
MRTARILLALPGLAALVWGAVLAVQFGLHSFRDGRSAVEFLIGGTLANDAIVAPVVGLAGLAISRFVGPAWRTPVRVGAAVSGVLALIAVPALWRVTPAVNPGLDDRNYGAGLLIALAVVWVVVVAAGLTGGRTAARAATARPGRSPRGRRRPAGSTAATSTRPPSR